MHCLGEKETMDAFPESSRHDDREDRRAANRAVGISAAGLFVTGLAELSMALLSGSVGLLGDALHNLADVSTSAVVYAGFRISGRSASQSHTYGYERAEDLAGLGVGLVIWVSAVFAAVASYHKLVTQGRTTHLGLAMAAAVVGIVGNQAVGRYKLGVGQRIHSATMVADARHSWLDALSSAGALLGLVAVALGHRWGDPVAGLVVTAFIVHVGWEVTGDILRHLMDAVDPTVVTDGEQAAAAVDGVHHAHVRARWAGRSLLVEVEGFVDRTATVGQGEALGRSVQDAVFAALPEARSVTWSPRVMPEAGAA